VEDRTFRIETLGCRANQYDSQRLADALIALGLRVAAEGEAPGVVLINTCTVTGTADRKARQLARRAVREHPGARVYVTGCYATSAPEAVREIDGLAGVFARGEWNELLADVAGGAVPAGARIEGDFGVARFCGRARALVKIQEGCDFFCAYCIVPHVRGRPRSRRLDEVLREAETLIAQGFRELVLTGIHLGLYGADLAGGVDLADAVAAVAALPGLERLRLSSIEPPEVTARLLDAMQRPTVCAHLAIPLQSGDDAVLRRMGRRYSARDYLATVALARERLDRPAITTDVVVGFPGETDEEFARTLGVCGEARFSRMHVFPFSARPGTPAAEMGGRVASKIVKVRCAQLQALADEMAHAWAESFVGQTVRVLFEEREGGDVVGYTDRYVRLRAPGGDELLGTVQRVRCTGAEGAGLIGEVTA